VVFANQVLEWQGRGMTFPKVALVYLSSDMADAQTIVKKHTGKQSVKKLLKTYYDEYRRSLITLLNDMKSYNITHRIVMGPTAFEVQFPFQFLPTPT
jgi:geranylgeranyl pyrophosphate synthase